MSPGEPKARTGEHGLREIVDLVPGMLYRMLLTPDGRRRITFVSPGVQAIYDLTPAQVLADGDCLTRARHPDDAERVAAAARDVAQRRAPLEIEFRIVRPDGSQRWVHSISSSAPDEDGCPVRVGVVLDISDRKHAEQAVLDNGRLWQQALEGTSDGMWDWSLDGGGASLSAPLRALYGYTEAELPDRSGALDALTHPDDRAEMQRARDAHLSGCAPAYVNEHRVRCKDGQWKWVLTRGIVISRDADGRALRMVGTHTDLTAQKQAQALRLERDRAAAASVAQSQFLSRVSHELRTPLNAILGFAQLLQLEPGAGERQRGWTQHVIDSGRHLLALMNDILDISSAQAGEPRLRPEPLALRVVLDEAMAMVAGTAREAGVTLLDELPPAGAPLLHADRRRLKQIVGNLLSNAIKYNRRGGWVRVGARVHDGLLELSVADSGAGIEQAQLARLFQPFERLGAECSAVDGTGLGLALSRQLAEAMGGSIAVSSAPGRGSTFTLRLPLP